MDFKFGNANIIRRICELIVFVPSLIVVKTETHLVFVDWIGTSNRFPDLAEFSRIPKIWLLYRLHLSEVLKKSLQQARSALLQTVLQ